MIERALQTGVEDEFRKTFDRVAGTLEEFGCDVDVRDTHLVASLPYATLDEKAIMEFSAAFGSEEIGEFLTETVKDVLRDTLSDIARENGETVARHLDGRNPDDLSVDGMRAVLDAMNDELEYDWDELASFSSLIIRCGYGVRQERRFSTPEGIAIHLDMADDEACLMPPYVFDDGKVSIRPMGLSEGYLYMHSAMTCAGYPEDVTIEDAKAACGRFLEGMRLSGADAERERMEP